MAATDKIQITYDPPLPFTCSVCGKSANGHTKFLDWGVSVDYYGAILMCEECAKQAVATLGFVKEQELEEAISEYHLLQERVDTLEAENGTLRSGLSAVSDLSRLISDDSDSAVPSDDEDGEVGESKAS